MASMAMAMASAMATRAVADDDRWIVDCDEGQKMRMGIMVMMIATRMAAPRVVFMVVADTIAMVMAMLTSMRVIAAGGGDGDDDGDGANTHFEDDGCASDRH